MPLGTTFTRLLLITLLSSLGGCEATLRLEAVERERNRALRRSDQFQAVTRNDSHIVVVGSAGVVITSSDGGETWQRRALPDSPPLIDIASCPNQSFIALDFDGRLWHGDAQAQYWKPYKIPSEESPVAVACDSSNHFWVTGGFSTLLRTSNAKEWDDLSFGEDQIITEIQFLDEKNVILSAEFGHLYFSQDGGHTWAPGTALPDEFYPLSTFFLNEQQGWVGGLKGYIFYTRNGGKSWQLQDSQVTEAVYKILQVGNHIVGIGNNGAVTRLQGQNWRRWSLQPKTSAALSDALRLNQESMLIVGERGTLRIARLGS